jgi:uncharacterized protein YndB with AHSA1/START domain
MRFLWKAFKFFLVLVILLGVWSFFRANTPSTAFRREIVVNVPPEIAWDHFSRPRQWASWLGEAAAPTEVTPSDVIGPDTVAKFGNTVTFRMTRFAPHDHWMWSADMGWLRADYDHRFERISDRQTRMVFHQTVTGFGNDVLATLIGALTAATGHQDALNRLAAEINQLPAAKTN